MSAALVPHAQVNQRARAELDQVNAAIAEAEAELRTLDTRLTHLADEQRERSEAKRTVYVQRADWQRRCGHARRLATLAKDTPAADDAAFDLIDLERALEKAEQDYQALERAGAEQDGLAMEESKRLQVERQDTQRQLDALLHNRAELEYVTRHARAKEGEELRQAILHEFAALEADEQAVQRTVDELVARRRALAATIAPRLKDHQALAMELELQYGCFEPDLNAEVIRRVRALALFIEEHAGSINEDVARELRLHQIAPWQAFRSWGTRAQQRAPLDNFNLSNEVLYNYNQRDRKLEAVAAQREQQTRQRQAEARVYR